MQILPRPYQKSGPPLWIGASVDAAARRAGRIADGFVGTPSTSMANATHLAEVYKDAAPKAGRARRCRADARRLGGQDTRGGRRGLRPPRHDRLPLLLGEPPRGVPNIAADSEFTLKTLAPDRLILGDPETCVREFQRWQKATGASTFLLRLRHAHSGGPPHDRILEAIRLFGERVLPVRLTSRDEDGAPGPHRKNSTSPVSRLYIAPAIFTAPERSRSASTVLRRLISAIVSSTFFRATASTNP